MLFSQSSCQNGTFRDFGKMTFVLQIWLYAATLHTLLVQAISLQAPIVTIDSGVVLGTTSLLPSATTSVNKFLSIPYAQTPPDRFSPPQHLSKSDDTINATVFKSACIQAFPCK